MTPNCNRFSRWSAVLMLMSCRVFYKISQPTYGTIAADGNIAVTAQTLMQGEHPSGFNSTPVKRSPGSSRHVQPSQVTSEKQMCQPTTDRHWICANIVRDPGVFFDSKLSMWDTVWRTAWSICDDSVPYVCSVHTLQASCISIWAVNTGLQQHFKRYH